MEGESINFEEIASDSDSDPVNLEEVADKNVNDTITGVADIAKSLQEPLMQPEIAFPKSQFGNELRSFNGKYYKLYPWIEYSILEDSIYYYPCRFFNFAKSKPDQNFIKRGFKNWKRASEKNAGFLQHDNSFLHKKSMVFWSSYKQQQKENKSVRSQLSNAHQILVKENREYIKIVIESLLYLASQGLALRGHNEG